MFGLKYSMIYELKHRFLKPLSSDVFLKKKKKSDRPIAFFLRQIPDLAKIKTAAR
jgi:hypothetical protein